MRIGTLFLFPWITVCQNFLNSFPALNLYGLIVFDFVWCRDLVFQRVYSVMISVQARTKK